MKYRIIFQSNNRDVAFCKRNEKEKQSYKKNLKQPIEMYLLFSLLIILSDFFIVYVASSWNDYRKIYCLWYYLCMYNK